MTTTDKDRARFDAAFQQIAEVIRTEEHNDASIVRSISQIIPWQPDFAIAMSSNIADILDGHTESVNYAEVVVEAYRRSLFPRADESYCSIDVFQGDPARAEAFAANMQSIKASGERHIVGGGIHYMN